MQILVLLAIITLTFAIWVWRDEMTERVFDAFGASFIYIWYNSGHRWRFMYMASWRLLMFVAFPIACTCLAYRFWVEDPFRNSYFVNACSFLAIGLTGCTIFPWINFNRRRRYWERNRAGILRLTQFIDRAESGQLNEGELIPADYKTLPPWTAWHPNDESDWRETWKDFTPVVYINKPESIVILQSDSCNTFLTRTNPSSVASLADQLPFGGPFRTTYVKVKSGRIRGTDGWWYLRTEPEFFGDDVE